MVGWKRAPQIVVRHVPDRDVFSRDTRQASHPCVLSLRWLWLLLTRQRAPLQDGHTPLHLAAWGGEEKAMKVLLEAGADRKAKDNVSCAADLSRVIFKGSGGTANQSSLGGESGCVRVGFGE